MPRNDVILKCILQAVYEWWNISFEKHRKNHSLLFSDFQCCAITFFCDLAAKGLKCKIKTRKAYNKDQKLFNYHLDWYDLAKWRYLNQETISLRVVLRNIIYRNKHFPCFLSPITNSYSRFYTYVKSLYWIPHHRLTEIMKA